MPAAAAIAIFVAGAALGVGSTHLLPRTEVAGGDESRGDPRRLAGGGCGIPHPLHPRYARQLPDDRSRHEAELKSVGDKLALGLSVDKVALDGLVLKRSQLFNLDGRPLAQIAYLTSDDGPVAFCIIADGAKDQAPSFEERRGKNIVYWSKAGHAFMLIGNLSRSTLETLAASLAARVA